jgi:hypothetical protein
VRFNPQAVRDVAASHARLIHLFERINFFLQRLNIYTEIPLTIELAELLGKIMAQLLSILAFSTKEMADRKMSEFIYSPFASCLSVAQKRFLRDYWEGPTSRILFNG